jgi:hypothetical protein
VTNLIAIAGAAQAGKDTVAGIINRHEPHAILHFADALRDLAMAVDPLIAEAPFGGVMAWPQPLSYFLRGHDYAWTKEHTNYRDVLVRLGAGARRCLGEDVWIKALERRLPDCPVVIADCRYANEANWVKALGGEVWYVYRPCFNPANEEERFSLGHIRGLGLVDVWIANDGDLDELEATVVEELGQ